MYWGPAAPVEINYKHFPEMSIYKAVRHGSVLPLCCCLIYIPRKLSRKFLRKYDRKIPDILYKHCWRAMIRPAAKRYVFSVLHDMNKMKENWKIAFSKLFLFAIFKIPWIHSSYCMHLSVCVLFFTSAAF